MKFVDYNGETIALILAQPNWATPPRVTDTLPFTSLDKAISGREKRQAFGTSNRYLFEFSPRFATADKSTEFRIGLNRLTEETVAVPLWTDGVQLSGAHVVVGDTTLSKTSLMPARFGSEWIIVSPEPAAWNNWAYEIVVVTSVNAGTIILDSGITLNWPSGTFMYPLLFGRLEERPSMESITPQTVRGGLSIRENSSYARRINPQAVTLSTVGANIAAFSATPLWDTEPEWSQQLDTTEIEIAYEQLGFTREEQSYTAQQTVRRGLEMGFVCKTRDAIAKIERLFNDRRGPVKPFMVPTYRADLIPTADVPIGGATDHIHIASSEYSDPDRPPHPGDGFMAFIDPAGATPDPVKITDVAGTDLTTAVAIATTHLAATTRLSFLLLARFAEPQIAWEYQTPSRARVRIKFLEVADEYVTPNTESEPAFLYKFTEILPTLQAHFFTSYENSIDWDGSTWNPAPFSHGSIKSGYKLDREEVELTSWGGNFPTNPLAKFFPYSLEGDLFLDIVRVNAANPDDGSAKIIFAGIITKPDFTGKNWKVTARWLGNLLDRNVPRFFFQKTCGTALYSAKCGVNADAYKVTATIDAIDEEAVDLGDGGGFAENYFAGGYIRTNDLASPDFERRAILHSESLGGGVRLVLDRPFGPAVDLGNKMVVFPGCNYSLQMCVERFDNLANFRGQAYIPIKNPSANIGELQTATGGKKG